MANQNIDMSKLRQILKFYDQHKGTCTIRVLTGVSRNVDKKYIALYKALQIPWNELGTLNERDLNALFLEVDIMPDPPAKHKELYAYFPAAEKRLKQPRMTLKLL